MSYLTLFYKRGTMTWAAFKIEDWEDIGFFYDRRGEGFFGSGLGCFQRPGRSWPV